VIPVIPVSVLTQQPLFYKSQTAQRGDAGLIFRNHMSLDPVDHVLVKDSGQNSRQGFGHQALPPIFFGQGKPYGAGVVNLIEIMQFASANDVV